jgi:hypothetical protein
MNLHGSATWPKRDDIQKLGLFDANDDGVNPRGGSSLGGCGDMLRIEFTRLRASTGERISEVIV